jgi:aspartyl-tRNA(Asn)/glutamyl-tRNA(Gln) amidotransferase subunit C
MSKKTFGEETVRKVAELARLKLSDQEVARFAEQVGDILEYVEKLNALNTDGVEPLTHALDLTTAFRDDQTQESPGAEEMTRLAPESLYENFKVPQVMGGGN